MQQKNLLAAFKLWSSQSLKCQFSNAKNWRAATVLGLLAVAIMSVTLSRQIITTAHAQEAAQVPDSASLVEANLAAANSSPKKEAVEQEAVKTESSDVPIIQGGTGACGWTAGTVYPITVLDNAVASVGNNLYSFSGISGGAFVANSYRFDGTTWTAIAPLPVAVESPAAASNGTFVYIVGGANNTGASVNTLYRYDPVANTYTTLAPAPTATWNSAAVYLNGRIYKIDGFVSTGGTGGTTTASNAVEVYDIASNTWTSAANYPLALGFVSGFAQGNFLYGAGGVNLTSGAGSVKTYRYDPSANTWDDASIADLPADRWGAATANYNGKGVLAGGFIGGVVSNTAVQWQSTTNTWVTLPNMLQARGRLAGGVANGNFYAIGGRSAAGGFNGTNDNQQLSATGPCIQSSVAFVSDSGGNNTPDPGETVTVSLSLLNFGATNTGTVTATLQASGGIVPVTTSQSFGVLTADAVVQTRNFTFTVPSNAACGSSITLTFNVTDGTTTTSVTQTYTLGTLQTSLSQNFDGVTAPALPVGWTVQTASGTPWVTTTTTPDSPPNAAFADDPGTVTDKSLVSPAVTIGTTGTATSQITFRNNYNTESTFDGMVLEISTDGGTTFTDIITAGGTFAAGGYNGTISANFMSPIGGRMAWTGNSNGYINSTVNLPASLNGQTVRFRWRMASDSSVAGVGVFIDGVRVLGSYSCQTGSTTPTNTRLDFDGDGKTDVSVFRNGTWYVQQSTGGFSTVQWGVAGDQLVPADYDGDGKTDYAVYRPTPTVGILDFYVLYSSTNTLGGVEWGTTGDIAKPGNFVGDNKADFAVYRPSNNTWYILPSAGGALTITTLAGTTNAFAPLVMDYDGDGKADLAQVNNGNWYIRRSTDGIVVNLQFGQAGDRFVPADYDNDNKDDLAVFRNGTWIALKSSTNTVIYINFGQAGDIPVPGDYDGDGADDQAVYRNGVWYINRSTGGFQAVTFGTSTDIAVPSIYVQ